MLALYAAGLNMLIVSFKPEMLSLSAQLHHWSEFRSLCSLDLHTSANFFDCDCGLLNPNGSFARCLDKCEARDMR